ncbi:hypothetical protein Q0Z83_014160 [Actinoplanes sichuanensis]|nr:hypothetical protein Q0Z83_014160 [Actinoplanes sichuanensis]
MNTTAPTTVCNVVSVTVSNDGRASLPESVTCAARTTAAININRSPTEGVRNPGPATSRNTPAVATAAAIRNRLGSPPCMTGVSRMVRLISTPALVALVSDTPYVSRTSTVACVQPSRIPTASSRRCTLRRNISGSIANIDTR